VAGPGSAGYASRVWRIVDSTSIRAVRYSEERRALAVRFRSGAAYEYAGVPPDEYARLLAAESLGAYLNTRIKPRFPFSRL
jgi:hypothetical protein